MTPVAVAMDTDAKLAEQCRRGDRWAFEELVRRSARGVFARFYLETADAHLAEDLVQETFLLAWKSIRSLSDPKAFRGWLYSVANSVLVDSIRREGRKKRGGEKDGAASMQIAAMVKTGPQPDEAADLAEQRTRMLAVLRAMPVEYRQPLMLRYLIGADYETISRELAITNGSLRGLLSRGMDMLRERLREK